MNHPILTYVPGKGATEFHAAFPLNQRINISIIQDSSL